MLKTGRLTEALALHEANTGALSSEDAAMLDAAWTDSSTWEAVLGAPESAEEALPFDTNSSDESNWLSPQRDGHSATFTSDRALNELSQVVLNSSVSEDENTTASPARFQNAGFEAIDGRQDGKVRRDTDESYVTINGDMPPFPPISTLQSSRTSSGAFNTVKPELRDYAMRAELSAYATGGAVAFPDAARLLRQFLYATGKTLDVDVHKMLEQISGFKQATESSFDEKVISQINDVIDRDYRGRRLKFSTTPKDWSQFVAGWGSQWRWALGEFNYTFTSTVTVEPRPNGFVLVSVERNIHVFDRYDWNKGQKFKLPNGRVIADDDVARLQVTGMGRDFDIRATMRLEPRHYVYKVNTVPEKPKRTI